MDHKSLKLFRLIKSLKHTLWLNRIRSAREFIFCIQGLRIGKGSQLGRIFATWPHNISIGEYCLIEDGVTLNFTGPCTHHARIRIGNCVHISADSHFNIQNEITVGNDVMIGAGCRFIDHNHGFEDAQVAMRCQAICSEPISIDDNTWIGSNVIILKGVSIGSGSVIGAGSVVVKPVPAMEVWAGNPAKRIRKRC